MKNLIYLFSILLLLISCNNPEKNKNSDCDFEKIDQITGIAMTDDNGSPIGLWEKPNHKPGSTRLFPNPSTTQISIVTDIPASTYWIVPADCCMESTLSDLESEVSDISFTESSLDNKAVNKITSISMGSIFTISTEMLDEGFYRVFIKRAEDEILWHNIYVNPNVPNIPDLEVLDDFCN